MLHSRYIVVEDYPDDSSRVVYNGASSIEAQKALGISVEKGEAQAVLYFSHPMHNQVRYPLQEKAEVAERARQSELARNAEANRKTLQAQAKRDQAKKLAAEAAALEAQAAAHLDAPEQTLEPEPAKQDAGESSPDSKPKKNGKPKKSEKQDE